MFALAGLLLHVRRLPPQNLFAIALLLSGSAALVEWCARQWQFPFAPLPETLIGFWSLPFAWITVIMFSRRIAQVIFRACRTHANYGLFILGTTVLLSGIFWGAMESYLAEWNLLNVIGRSMAALAMLLLIFPWLIEKKPRRAGEQVGR